MPESTQHARLVRAILNQLETHIGPFNTIMVRDDSLSPLRGERPPPLPRFIPDVYATDVPITRVVVGEAKTAKDLQSTRSRVQIASFLDYLTHTPNSLFILAVPFDCTPQARGILRELAPATGTVTATQVINDVDLGHG